MKKLLAIIGFIALSAATALAADTETDSLDNASAMAPVQTKESLWEQANTAYINGDYAGAAAMYEQIVSDGYVGAPLFYNLGNAYFKAGELGRSILNYNKALRLSPYDKDTEYNLSVANSYIKDRIEQVPEFFLSRWLHSWRSTLDSNAWALCSLILLAVTLGGVLLFLVAERKALRKTGFFTGIVAAILFVFATSFSIIEGNELKDATEAIVIAQSAAVKSSPDSTGSDLFIIHEGTKVEVLSSFDGWTEIMIADGNKGWVIDEAVERIMY